MPKSRTLSVSQYAAEKKITTQAVRWQIKNNKLPDGVKAEKCGWSYVITIHQ